jgi:hypothetical protein
MTFYIKIPHVFFIGIDQDVRLDATPGIREYGKLQLGDEKVCGVYTNV